MVYYATKVCSTCICLCLTLSLFDSLQECIQHFSWNNRVVHFLFSQITCGHNRRDDPCNCVIMLQYYCISVFQPNERPGKKELVVTLLTVVYVIAIRRIQESRELHYKEPKIICRVSTSDTHTHATTTGSYVLLVAGYKLFIACNFFPGP